MKNKGFTLLETIIVTSIALIMMGTAGVSLSNYNKNKDLKTIREGLYETFRTMALDAAESRERIDIEFDYNNYLILFKKDGKITQKFNLPKAYNYSNTSSSRHFTESGNISPMFSFYIQEKTGKDLYKLTFDSTDKFVQSVNIRRYINVDSTWSELEK